MSEHNFFSKQQKEDAEGILVNVALELAPDSAHPAKSALAQLLPQPGLGSKVLHQLLVWVSKVDTRAVQERVAELKTNEPQLSSDDLIDRLIQQKCKRVAAIGAASSAASSIPVLGTALSLTLGMVVDVSSSITAQAELVLEIAEALNHPLSEANKRETILWILGLGIGSQQLAGKAGKQMGKSLSHKLGQHYTRRWFAKALPVIGIASSASTNSLSTYIIGQRAKAYFSLGPESVGDWKESLRAISGVDERKLAGWLAEGTQKGLTAVGDASKAAVESVKKIGEQVGSVVVGGTKKGFNVVHKTGVMMGGTVVEGTQKSLELIYKAGQEMTQKTQNIFSDKDKKRKSDLDI